MKEYIVHALNDNKIAVEEYVSFYGEPITELIRCKDCKHYRNNKCDQLSLLLFLLGNEEDDYCSHAEREEE